MTPNKKKLNIGVNEFKEQIQFLVSSSIAYDKGSEAEAKRLALAIRIFVYDTRNSTSLLTHMKLRDRLPFFSLSNARISANPSHKEWAWDSSLTLLYLSLGGPKKTRLTHLPIMYSNPKGILDENGKRKFEMAEKLPFDKWWGQQVVCIPADYLHGSETYNLTEPQVMTRGDVVLSVANRDGGAHIDSALDVKHYALSRVDLSPFLIYEGSDGNAQLSFRTRTQLEEIVEGHTLINTSNRLDLAIVRAISHELIFSLAIVQEASSSDPLAKEEIETYIQHAQTELLFKGEFADAPVYSTHHSPT